MNYKFKSELDSSSCVSKIRTMGITVRNFIFFIKAMWFYFDGLLARRIGDAGSSSRGIGLISSKRERGLYGADL
jgi:hypothetical protein